MQLPDSALKRSIKTFFQAAIGFLVGLIVTVWLVPGVPHAIITYVDQNLVYFLLAIGIPSGLASFIMNLFNNKISNW
jgi:hypothetical protein